MGRGGGHSAWGGRRYLLLFGLGFPVPVLHGLTHEAELQPGPGRGHEGRVEHAAPAVQHRAAGTAQVPHSREQIRHGLGVVPLRQEAVPQSIECAAQPGPLPPREVQPGRLAVVLQRRRGPGGVRARGAAPEDIREADVGLGDQVRVPELEPQAAAALIVAARRGRVPLRPRDGPEPGGRQRLLRAVAEAHGGGHGAAQVVFGALPVLSGRGQWGIAPSPP